MLCGFLSEAAKKDCVKKCDGSYNPICGKVTWKFLIKGHIFLIIFLACRR